MVGGPGFDPGASRSRNLSGLVHRDRFRRFGVHFAAATGVLKVDFVHLDRQNYYYTKYYMKLGRRTTSEAEPLNKDSRTLSIALTSSVAQIGILDAPFAIRVHARSKR
jgi:hypothetical protein